MKTTAIRAEKSCELSSEEKAAGELVRRAIILSRSGPSSIPISAERVASTFRSAQNWALITHPGKQPVHGFDQIQIALREQDKVPFFADPPPKHHGFIGSILADLESLKPGMAMNIPLKELRPSKEKIRSTLNRATNKEKISVATASDAVSSTSGRLPASSCSFLRSEPLDVDSRRGAPRGANRGLRLTFLERSPIQTQIPLQENRTCGNVPIVHV